VAFSPAGDVMASAGIDGHGAAVGRRHRGAAGHHGLPRRGCRPRLVRNVPGCRGTVRAGHYRCALRASSSRAGISRR
jgi:hypothetical protein